MMNRLPVRLLLSYLAVVGVLLGLLLILLVREASSTTGGLRSVQTATELNALAQPVLVQVQNAWRTHQTLPEFRQSLDNIAADAGVRLLWVEQQSGRVLHDSDSAWQNREIRVDQVSSRQSVLQNVGFYNAPDGTTWVFYAPPAPTAFDRTTSFVLAKEATSALDFFRSAFAQPLRQSALIAALLSLVLAGVMTRWVSRPLQKLAKAANEVAQGRYEREVVLEGPIEVQSVAADFNQMAHQVQTTQQAQRDFLANVSHDLKTPITSIQGWSQALLDGTASDTALRRRSAEIINAEAERMSHMVHDLLDLARLESGEYTLTRQHVRLGDILYAVRDTLAVQAHEKDVMVAVDAAPLAAVYADPDRLRQLFANLLDNALVHTPTGGTVTLSCRQEATTIVAKVSDTGTGIEAGEIDRVFERFYQTDKSRARTRPRNGIGLGLAICREIVQAHDGTISVESVYGHGTTFVITLPRAQQG